MKKIFLILVMFMLTLTCGVLLTACGGGSEKPNDRVGEKCYIEVENYNVNPYDYRNIIIDYGTSFNGNDDWHGFDESSKRDWFIKGDIVKFKVYCSSQFYYIDQDLKLDINGQLIDTECKEGFMPSTDVATRYCECSYQIQSDINVSCANIKQHTANVTLKAKSDNELWQDYLDLLDGQDPNCTKEQYLSDVKQNYYNDNVKVRFEDKDVFGLPKSTYGMNELRDYLIEHNVVGVVGAGTGTNVYCFTNGYTQVPSFGFKDTDVFGDAKFFVDGGISCYINEQDNEYGYEVNIRPNVTYQEVKNMGFEIPEGVSLDDFKDGIVLLDIEKVEYKSQIFGRIEDLDYDGYHLHTNIDEVRLDNSIFSIKYGNGAYGEELDLSDFNQDEKLNVKIKLNKYSNVSWKSLYDKMKIKISDRYIDYTISSNGIIDLVLDRPYKYFNLSIHGDVEQVYNHKILANYMYHYYMYFDIIDLALDAGLVVENNWDYYYEDWLKISPSGVIVTGLFDNMIGRIVYDDLNVDPKALMVGDEDMYGNFINLNNDYVKVEITDQDNNKFMAKMITVELDGNSNNKDEYLAALNQLKNSSYIVGQEAVILKIKYSMTNPETQETTYSYYYFIRVLAKLNIKRIEFKFF